MSDQNPIPNDVPMLAPDGTPGMVPQANATDAEQKGFRRGIAMLSPDGKPGVVPLERMNEALDSGFTAGTVMVSPGGVRGVVPQGRAVRNALAKGFGFHQPSVQSAIKPPIPAELQNGESTAAAIGKNIPEAAVPALSFIQKNVNEPLNKMAEGGAEFGKELGRDVVSGINLLTHPENGGSPYAYGPVPPRPLTLEQEAEQKHPIAMGIAGGAGSVAGGAVADPRNWPFLVSSAARPLLQRLISGGFGVQMGKGAVEGAVDLNNNWDNYSPEQRAEKLTSSGISAVLAWLSLAHAATGGEAGGEPVTPKPPGQALRIRGSKTPESAPEAVTPEAVVPGPGAMNSPGMTGVRESGSDIAQITDSLRAQIKDKSPSESVDLGQRLGESRAAAVEAANKWMGDAKAKALGTLEKVKSTSQSLWAKYTAPPDAGDLAKSVADWQYALQKSDLELSRYADAVKKAFPDKARREAMSIYAEAAGDLGKLSEWEKGSKSELAGKYRDAQNLTDEEKLFAQNARNYWDAKLDQAIQAGILEHGIEDYVSHIVKRENPITNELKAQIDTGTLNTNPSFAKKRIHDTIFALEQSGHLAETDLGFLMSAYEQSFNRAVAARTYIKSLLSGKASDGRPLAVPSAASAKLIEAKPGELDNAYLVRPNLRPQDYGDYRSVNHPALRGWKWADKMWGDRGGPDTNTIVQGDLLIHPEAVSMVKNNLGRSWFRTPTTGGMEVIRKGAVGLQKIGQTIKGTMLDLSGFHQSQISLHGAEHLVKPWDLVKEIDLNNPKQRELVRWGMQVADYRAMEAFSEGSTHGSLVRKVPGLGQVAQHYNQYLFRSFIPRMKMTMGLHALERNIARYQGKLSMDQIYRLTAEQSNAAFGELNYRMLGRNPTFQDFLRLSLLAPDFAEARGRFLLQGLKPFGREQSRALITGAVALYVMARIINQGVSGDPHWDKPFSVIHNGKEYRLRTVQGDIEHLIRDPRNFAYVRLNPATSKVAIEALTGRDEWGRQQPPSKLLTKTVEGAIPIAAQKAVKNPDDFSLIDSVLGSIGISSSKLRLKGAQPKQTKLTLKGKK